MIFVFLFLFVLIAFVVGVATVFRWVFHIFLESVPSRPNQIPSPIPPLSEKEKEREVLRLKLEHLYFEKKISLEEMNEILSSKRGLPSDLELMSSVSKDKQEPVHSSPVGENKTVSSASERSQLKSSHASTKANGDAASSGFFTSASVKTLLLSGSALLLFSVYLFVRSYWDFIPNAAKFISLNILTLALYSGGYILCHKGRVPKTANTLLSLGLALIPFNAYAANSLILSHTLSANGIWALGSALMFPAALLTAEVRPSLLVGILIGASVVGSSYFAPLAFPFPQDFALMSVSIATVILLGAIFWKKGNEDILTGVLMLVLGTTVLNLLGLFVGGFFLSQANLIPTVINLTAMGIAAAILARNFYTPCAYLAGACFMGAGAILLRQFHTPVYKFGYFFIPAGFISILRAWTFEKAGKIDLARPYFWLGQMAVMLAILCVGPVFSLPRETDMFSLIILLAAASSAYAVMGAFYKQSVYTYASGFVVLFLTWFLVWENDFPFASGLLFFTGLSCFFIVIGLLGGGKMENQVGTPLTILGLGTITISLSLLAGRWGNQILTTGTIVNALPPDQLTAGLWTGSLSALAYGFLAAVKKRSSFLYPALLSATWVYICWLQKFGIPFNLLSASWLVAGSLLLCYGSRLMGGIPVSKAFGLWGEMVALFIAVCAVYTQSQLAIPAVLICTFSFLPSIWWGDVDLVTGFLFGTYLSHFLWFQQSHGLSDPAMIALYSLQMVVVNLSVVFLRTLVTRARPANSVTPYRTFALVFSGLSLALSMTDFNIAWQVFLEYGVLALAVSWVHYEGRFMHVGVLLIFASCEFFFKAQKFDYIEIYTLPLSLYILWAAYHQRESKDLRDFLYCAAQVVLYLPSSVESMQETWAMHGIFLGVASLAIMLFGMHQRNRYLTFGSAFILVANGFVQSRQFFLTVPRWIYLGVGGLSLIGLGGLFEFQRETLIQIKKKMASSLEGWD